MNIFRHFILLFGLAVILLVPSLYRPLRKGKMHPLESRFVSVIQTTRDNDQTCVPLETRPSPPVPPPASDQQFVRVYLDYDYDEISINHIQRAQIRVAAIAFALFALTFPIQWLIRRSA